MLHQEFKPPEELQDAIKCFWYTQRDFGDRLTGFEVVPDGYAEIIFHFGGGCSISRDGALQPLPSPFLVGLLNNPMVFYATNRMEILGIRCFPWTVFDLLGLPAGKVSVQVFEHAISRLQTGLSKCLQGSRIADAIGEIQNYFVQSHTHLAKDSLLLKAGVAMRVANGTLPVGRVAAEAHATVRSLERKFRKSSGHSVKDVSGLMRFEQVRNRLWTNPASGLAGLAGELGYTDQSHLSREFKKYSGITPGAFARKAKSGKRLISPDFVAFIPDHA